MESDTDAHSTTFKRIAFSNKSTLVINVDILAQGSVLGWFYGLATSEVTRCCWRRKLLLLPLLDANLTISDFCENSKVGHIIVSEKSDH